MNIQIKNLIKHFNVEPVLRGIDLDFPFGSRLALVGANGSGKSTLLRAIMGMISYEGAIHFTDSTFNRLSDLEIKREIAYVPQISPYFSTLVSDVVATVLSLRRVTEEVFTEHLTRLHLDYKDVAQLPFQKLSGGMKQKLLIALAFASRSRVFLLDEPTASLDPESRESFYQLGEELSLSSLLLCSHRLEEIHQLVDQVVVLDKGVITFKGSVEEYLQKILPKKDRLK